jgi:uncharacterized SAM-binding protein YcdF (DUF218 family)
MGRFVAVFLKGLVVTLAAGLVGLASVGHVLQVEDPLAQADAIVAISGDTGPRVRTAVDLWKRGYAARVIFSGGSEDPLSASSAELMKRQALAFGVPEEAIVVEGGSSTTEENAEQVALVMRGAGLRSAILVTSPFHQRRASMHFGREFDRHGLVLRNHPADDPRWDPTLWWAEEPSRTLTIVELAKLAYEVVDGRLVRPAGAAALP